MKLLLLLAVILQFGCPFLVAEALKSESDFETQIYTLPTNTTLYFRPNTRKLASIRFNPDNTFTIISTESGRASELGGGNWAQGSDGIVFMEEYSRSNIYRGSVNVTPTQYKGRVFLVSPHKYKSNITAVCAYIDSPTNIYPIFNEFMVSEDVFYSRLRRRKRDITHNK